MLCAVDVHVQQALCRGGDWSSCNLCPPCMYKLTNKLLMKFSMLAAMDSNNSLKLIDNTFRSGLSQADDHASTSSWWLKPKEVDQFKDEVINSHQNVSSKYVVEYPSFLPHTTLSLSCLQVWVAPPICQTLHLMQVHLLHPKTILLHLHLDSTKMLEMIISPGSTSLRMVRPNRWSMYVLSTGKVQDLKKKKCLHCFNFNQLVCYHRNFHSHLPPWSSSSYLQHDTQWRTVSVMFPYGISYILTLLTGWSIP